MILINILAIIGCVWVIWCIIIPFINYLIYLAGHMIFYFLSIEKKRLPGRKWNTFKFFLKMPWKVLMVDQVTSMRSKFWIWEPPFKYTRIKREN